MMPRLVRVSTAKAYASALSTGIAAALAALAPFVDGGLAVALTVVLAVLASYGVTYAVPNAPRRGGAHRLDDLVDGVLGRPADSPGGAPNA